MRFHSPTPRLTSSTASILLDVDGSLGRCGWVAEVRRPWTTDVVGLVNLAAVAPGRAEIAVAVADAWQGRGIGREDSGASSASSGASRRLPRAGGRHALPTNQVARPLLRSTFPGQPALGDDQGVIETICPLTGPRGLRDLPHCRPSRPERTLSRRTRCRATSSPTPWPRWW